MPKPKFIIVTNNLRDYRGHYFETSVSIAEAARDAGYDPVLAAHVECPTDLFPEWLDALPVFRTDHWMQEPPAGSANLYQLSGNPYAAKLVTTESVRNGKATVTEFVKAHFQLPSAQDGPANTPADVGVPALTLLCRSLAFFFKRTALYVLPYALFKTIGGAGYWLAPRLLRLGLGVKRLCLSVLPSFLRNRFRRWRDKWAGRPLRPSLLTRLGDLLSPVFNALKRIGAMAARPAILALRYLPPRFVYVILASFWNWLKSEGREFQNELGKDVCQFTRTSEFLERSMAHPLERPFIAGAYRNAPDALRTEIEYGLVFKRDMESLLHVTECGPADHVFLGTAHGRELLAIFLLLQRMGPEQAPTFHLEFRHPLFQGAPSEEKLASSPRAQEYKFFYDLYERWGRCDRIKLYTDTEQLTKEYGFLLPAGFQTLPIPFRTRKVKRTAPRKAGPLNLAYFGDARDEKGFHWLPDLIDFLMEDHVRPGKIRFLLQATPGDSRYNPESDRALKRLRAYPPEFVTLVGQEGPLSPDDYYDLVRRTDIGMFPYDRYRYYAASSGTLAEAISAGAPSIVPAGSWLASQIAEGGGESFHDRRSFLEGVRRIVDQFPRYREAALAHSRNWLDKHNPRELVLALLNGNGAPAEAERPAALTHAST